MDIYVLNRHFEKIGIIDYCASIIWTRRYCNEGDCELYLPADEEALNLLKVGRFLKREDSEGGLMLITSVSVDSDIENGNFLTVKGLGAEHLISNRIVWSQTTLNGTVGDCVAELLNSNIINPSDTDRQMDFFSILDTSEGTESVTKQYTGDNLLTAIIELLATFNLGFDVSFDGSVLGFSIYRGIDRSFSQNQNSYVIFSPEYDNFLNSSSSESVENFKNIALVAGEGEGSARKRAEVGTASGIDRVELFVDARDISSTTSGGSISDNEYLALLAEKGSAALAESKNEFTYEGEILPEVTFIYEIDYNLGDIVETIDFYGNQNACRITEIIESWDENGYTIIPKFEIVEE